MKWILIVLGLILILLLLYGWYMATRVEMQLHYLQGMLEQSGQSTTTVRQSLVWVQNAQLYVPLMVFFAFLTGWSFRFVTSGTKVPKQNS